MSKVYLTEQQRLNERLAAWVYGQLRLRGMSQATLAKERGISPQLMGYRLKHRKIDFDDFCCFVRVFRPETEDLERLLGV